MIGDYPEGAASDPLAPWNERSEEEQAAFERELDRRIDEYLEDLANKKYDKEKR